MNIPKLTSDVSSHEAALIQGPWPKAYLLANKQLNRTMILPLFLTTGHGMSLNEMNPVAYSSGGGQGGSILEARVAILEAQLHIIPSLAARFGPSRSTQIAL
jgi:hypothetical protein